VNLGEDTDTTRAFTGGLAGLLYGFDTIPKSWLQQIDRKDDIIEIADRLLDFATANILVFQLISGRPLEHLILSITRKILKGHL
jgi:hypothetical protein